MGIFNFAGLEALDPVTPEVTDTQVEAAWLDYKEAADSMNASLAQCTGLMVSIDEASKLQSTIAVHGVTEGLMAMVNSDGSLNRLLKTTIPEITAANSKQVAEMCVEGLGDKVKRAWGAVVEFFKKLWAKIVEFFKKLWDRNYAMISKLKAIKEKLPKIKADEMAKIEMFTYKPAGVTAMIGAANGIIEACQELKPGKDMLSTFAGKFNTAAAAMGIKMDDKTGAITWPDDDKAPEAVKKAEKVTWTGAELGDRIPAAIVLLEQKGKMKQAEAETKKQFDLAIAEVNKLQTAEGKGATPEAKIEMIDAMRAALPALSRAIATIGRITGMVGGTLVTIGSKAPISKA